MTMTLLIAGVIVFLVIICGVLLWHEARHRAVEANMLRAIGRSTSQDLPDRLGHWLRALGERCRTFYSPANLENLRSMIRAAGANPHRVLPLLLGGKVVMMILLPLIVVTAAAVFVDSMGIRLALIGLGVIVGFFGPDWMLGIMRRRFIAALEQGTPDAIDLLVVCSEAGMGLESALEHVAQEMSASHRAMASILASLLDDLRILPNRRDAFLNLGTRSGVDSLRRVATMLSQSLTYGTPVGDTLRAVAGELRRERMNKLEEKAVKLPAKLIFPMIGFIMPSLYIVLLGPSFMRLYDTLVSVTGR